MNQMRVLQQRDKIVRRHVPLEHLVHDVLPQELLRLRDAFHERGLRETAAQQILVKMRHQPPPSSPTSG